MSTKPERETETLSLKSTINFFYKINYLKRLLSFKFVTIQLGSLG